MIIDDIDWSRRVYCEPAPWRPETMAERAYRLAVTAERNRARVADHPMVYWPHDVRLPTEAEVASAVARWERKPGEISLRTAMVRLSPDHWLPFFYRSMEAELRPWFKWRVAEVAANARSI